LILMFVGHLNIVFVVITDTLSHLLIALIMRCFAFSCCWAFTELQADGQQIEQKQTAGDDKERQR